ncbi:TIGR02234 family membrane protein [Streptomyces sp. NPDC102360]|uniref:TIGR02234 family membrane protein n=1 Tax=Streptomyces sp. NPDC102360 TaxID=3366160 RepID=UPI0037F1EC5F
MEYVTAVPHPRTDAAESAESAASSSNGRRSLAVALLCGAAGAAIALLASRQEWCSGVAAVAGGKLPLTAKGSDVTGVPAALAIVGLAALVAVFAVRKVGRVLVAVLLALSGAGAVAAAVLGAGDSAALDEKAAQAAGDASATIHALSNTAWPYVSAVGGALILIAGILAVVYGAAWPSMGGRYERSGAPRPRRAKAVDPERPEELWKALDRGEDPTGA